MAVDLSSIGRNDRIALGAGLLAVLLALVPGTRSFSMKDEFEEMAAAANVPTSDSVNLWHGIGVLAALLMILGVAVLAVRVFEVQDFGALPVRWIATAALGLATLFTLIYMFTYRFGLPGDVPDEEVERVADISAGLLGYVLLIVMIVATAYAALGAKESGEQLPGRAAPSTPPSAA